MADTGNTATITFGTSGFTANFHMLSGPEQERPKINKSHLGSADFEEYMPGDLVEPGEIEGEFEYDPDEQPPISAAVETITLTYPSALANGATCIGTGFVTRWSAPELRNNTLMVARVTVAFDGVTGPAWADAAA